MINKQHELLKEVHSYFLNNCLEPTEEEQSIIDKLKHELDNRTYEIDSLDKEYIEEMGYYFQSGDIQALANDMSEAYCEQDKPIEFNALIDKHGFQKHHKCCVCNKTVRDGFHALNNDDLPFPYDVYFCSRECLDKIFTELQWQQLCEENSNDYYYSEWR
jgi:hypothetical protein